MSFEQVDDGEVKTTNVWDAQGRALDPASVKTEKGVVHEAIRRKEGYVLTLDEKAPDKPAGPSSAVAAPLWMDERPWGVFLVVREPGMESFTLEDLRLLTIFAYHASTAAWRIDLVEELNGAFESTIRALLAALDLRDPTTSAHSIKVQTIAMGIATEMKIPDASKEVLRYAALLHDVGKLGIRDDILNKQGLLTDEERAKMAEHSKLTLQLLSKIKFPKRLSRVPEIASAHHEKMDGRGPLGIPGDKIPLEARILAVSDVFEALTATRSYKEVRRTFDAQQILDKMSIKDLDPVVIEALLHSLSL